MSNQQEDGFYPVPDGGRMRWLKRAGFGITQTWVQILALPLVGWYSGQVLPPLGFCFPLRAMGITLYGCPMDLCGHTGQVHVAWFTVITRYMEAASQQLPIVPSSLPSVPWEKAGCSLLERQAYQHGIRFQTQGSLQKGGSFSSDLAEIKWLAMAGHAIPTCKSRKSIEDICATAVRGLQVSRFSRAPVI